jgi:signal transduction histidine kinase
LDEKCAADGFLLVNFEFNRMADAIATLDDEKKERERDERAWIAGLAHDINTPMTIIRGYAENLAECGAFSESPEQLRYLSEILAQSLYMQALVDDLLTQASTRLTPLTITPEWVELSGFYDLIIDMFHFPAAARGIALIAEDNGLKVWVDPLRLRQILINLVRNALTHAGHLKCIELLAECCDGGVMLVVQDDGSGIEAGSETAIFTCGKRGEHSGVKGWGLGLAVVKMLTEAHNGYCRVAVGPQGGARFELWFPKKMVSLEES